MAFKDFEKFVCGNSAKAMITLAIASQLNTATAQEKQTDKKEHTKESAIHLENTHNSSSSNIRDLSFEFGIKTDSISNTSLPTVNGNLVRAKTNENIETELKNYEAYQKEAFEFMELCYHIDMWSAVPSNLATYDGVSKNVTIVNYELGKTEEQTIQKLKSEHKNSELNFSDSSLRRQAMLLHKYAILNDHSSPDFFGAIAHEFQHKNNDKHNIGAPGLNAEQYGILNQYDEISANLTHLLVLDYIYKQKVAAGISQDEALKIFDSEFNKNFKFYQQALKNGIDSNSAEGKKLLVQGCCEMWVKQRQPHYETQVSNCITHRLEHYDAASMAIGNEKEFKKRLNMIFDNLGENEVLARMRIKPEKLSQYLPKEIIGLSPKLKQFANDQTLHYTGMTLEQGKEISRRLHGSPKKDAKNLLEIMTGRKQPPKSLSPRKNNSQRNKTEIFTNRNLGR